MGGRKRVLVIAERSKNLAGAKAIEGLAGDAVPELRQEG